MVELGYELGKHRGKRCYFGIQLVSADMIGHYGQNGHQFGKSPLSKNQGEKVPENGVQNVQNVQPSIPSNGYHAREHGASSSAPYITSEKITFVLEKIPVRGSAWAREFMDRVEGFDRWPQRVQAAVQAAEREALE
jgi:hypothetical protein